MTSLVVLAYAVTAHGCRLGGAALLVGLGCVALLSRQIADAIWQRPDLITERNPPGERRASRRFYAIRGRWMVFGWAVSGAVGGFLVLVDTPNAASAPPAGPPRLCLVA